MPYEWLTGAIERLTDVEPHEVMEALSGEQPRRPVPATVNGIKLLTVQSRTRSGRALVVVLRHDGDMDYLIIASRQLTDTEEALHTDWEKEES